MWKHKRGFGAWGNTADLYNCDEALFAPQAELIGAIVQGAFGGDINLPMVILGAVIAVVLIRLAMPVMSVAIGIYLSLYLSVPIWLVELFRMFCYPALD